MKGPAPLPNNQPKPFNLNLTKMSNNKVEIPTELEKQLADDRRNDLHKTIKDFYDMGGVITPVETVTDLLRVFFSGVDPQSEDDNGKPLAQWKSWNDDYVSDLVYRSTEMIKFFINLNDDWDRYPENPRNVKPKN